MARRHKAASRKRQLKAPRYKRRTMSVRRAKRQARPLV